MTTSDAAQAIYLATKDKKGAALTESLKKSVDFLARKRLLAKAPEILSKLGTIADRAEGRMRVHLKSATKITETTRKEIHHALKNRYQAKEFIFDESLDPSLLGGVRIEVGDNVIDLSTKSKIGQLQEYLQKA